MPYDTSDRKSIRRAEKAASLADREGVQFLRQSLSSTAGRKWFHDLLERCHIFSNPFTGDALREAYLKGESNVGLRIWADIHAHCPDLYIMMMQEAQIRTLADARRNEPDSDHRGNGDASDDGGRLDTDHESDGARIND